MFSVKSNPTAKRWVDAQYVLPKQRGLSRGFVDQRVPIPQLKLLYALRAFCVMPPCQLLEWHMLRALPCILLFMSVLVCDHACIP